MGYIIQQDSTEIKIAEVQQESQQYWVSSASPLPVRDMTRKHLLQAGHFMVM